MILLHKREKTKEGREEMEDTLNASSAAARCWLLLWSVDYGWELGRIRASSAAAKGEERGRGAEAGSVCKGGMELLQRGRVEPGWLIVVGLIHLQLCICSIDGHELSARPPTTGRGAPPWAVGSWSTRGWAWSNPCARARGAELLRQGRPWAWAE